MVRILTRFSLNIDHTKQNSEVATLLNHAIERGEETFQTVFGHFNKIDGQFLKNCLENHPSNTTHCVIQSILHTNLLALKTLIEFNESYKNITSVNLPLLHYAMSQQFIEGVKHLIYLGLPLATHNTEQTYTLYSDKLKLPVVFTESKVGYKLGSGYVLTDIPNFQSTAYHSAIDTVMSSNVLFQNLVQCNSLEPLHQYISIHRSLQPSYKHEMSLTSSKYASLRIMEYLLNLKDGQAYFFDVDTTDSNGNTVVHNGVCNPCIQSFELLLDHLDRINTPGLIDKYGPSFLTTTKQIDRVNREKYSPIELSIKENKKEAFLALRKHGASYATEGSGQNILHRCITCGNTDISYLDLILEDLSQQKSELINEYNSTGYTPLHTAVNSGNTLVYSKLITVPSCKYDIVTKSEGNNIVHLAIRKGNPELLKLILEDLKNLEKDKNEENKLLNKENARQITPQFLAVEEGNIDLILDIPEFSGVDAKGISLLHYVVKCSDKSSKHLEMIKAIITKREEMVNARDNSNETPLHYAVRLPRESALRELLECSSIDFSAQNQNGMTPLHLAINRNISVLRLLLDAIAKLSESNRIHTHTPLYCAIQMKNIPCVEEFLKVNAPLPVLQRVDRTVTLCYRQLFPHTKVPMCLYDVRLEEKPDLHICVGFELSNTRWILSDLPNLSCTYLTPVIWNPSQSRQVSKIPNITESLLKSYLFACHCYEPLELVVNIVKYRKFTNDAKLMHLAAAHGTTQVVEYLMEFYGANIHFLDLDIKEYSIIHYSIGNMDKRILRILCERMKKDYPQEFTELSGKLLQFCIAEDHLNVFKILLETQYSANAAYTDKHGNTLLHLIVLRSRKVEYVRELLEYPQFVAYEYCNIVNNNSNTALHLAISRNQRNIVSEILKHKPDISTHDSHGDTALHLAIQNSTIDIIKDIVSYITGLPNKLKLINRANTTKSESRPIHLATQRGEWEVVELLLSNGAELYSLDAYSNTILHLTVDAVNNCLTMKTKILAYENSSGGSKFIHCQNENKRTPLHLAIEDGCVDCIKLLLNNQYPFGDTNKYV